MKILVTGTAGFIGYHLVKRLVQDHENDIIGLDNINNYYDQNLKYARLKGTGIRQGDIQELIPVMSRTCPNYRFIKLDLTDKENISNLFHEFKPNIVVNLAAQAGVRYSLENPNAYIQSNIAGFLNILEGCRHYPVKHLVYASSSSVYGNSTKVPFSEDDKTDTPVSLYAATKKSNELMAYAYSHLYNIPATGLRFFTVYGPYGRPDMAPALFAEAIMKGIPINIFNNGDLRRDFTYIDDITEGIIRVVSKAPDKTPPHAIYNIGCSNPVQLIRFVHILEEAIGKKADLRMLPMQQGDVYQTYADISILEKDFGYSPSVELTDGIKSFIKWKMQ
ncbi:MAG: NAD-dependent epimerase/dehydratase family protein [Tannerellaceae bacterium]|jgi:UDP-glucuronate 4-epimerase|nr:NAD-dependent epimerase/dehydratase family protein [Tannerellaceae bacterium]